MNSLVFKNINLNVIDRNGQQWLTARDIAKALYPYEDAKIDKGGVQTDTPFEERVTKLYRRHAEEFTESMTTLIDLETAGGRQKVRVFSLRGAHLLGMFARSKKAKEFRRWVLDIIERHNHERGILTTQYHQVLPEFATGKARASLCGKGLSDWKIERKRCEKRLVRIIENLQPDIFKQLVAR